MLAGERIMMQNDPKYLCLKIKSYRTYL